MLCKFCGEEIDHIGSFERSTCSWCQQEQPYFFKVCYICERPIEFEGGVAFCKCGKDYITEEGRKILDDCYNHYLQVA